MLKHFVAVALDTNSTEWFIFTILIMLLKFKKKIKKTIIIALKILVVVVGN